MLRLAKLSRPQATLCVFRLLDDNFTGGCRAGFFETLVAWLVDLAHYRVAIEEDSNHVSSLAYLIYSMTTLLEGQFQMLLQCGTDEV